MAKNLVDGENIVVEADGDDISLNISTTFNNNMNENIIQKIIETNSYSASEQVIGTWLGENLYRKVISKNCGELTELQWAIPYNITNLKMVTNIWGMLAGPSRFDTCYGPVTHPLQISTVYKDTYSNPDFAGTIRGSLDTGYTSSWTLYIIMEYTKGS
jgi:hypothetical protein